ncbi:MAG TPA: hypothetical protein VKX35_06900 [Fermentimonas sp.]|nr:hypothetical protein [Fermentimonas sp.]
MRRQFKIKSFLSILLIALLALSACKIGRKSPSDSTQPAETLKREKVEQDVREFVYPLPTSFEITEMLNRIGAAYILNLSNPTDNVKKYLTEKSKALNLGIYSADLSYASTYNQKQTTSDYMSVSKILIDALNISAAIDPNIVSQIEAKQDDKEALVDLITNTFYDTYEHLNKNNRSAVSMLILAGSWVEGLYIVTHISEDTYNNKEMVKLVMDQKSSLNKLIELMKVTESDPAIAETLKLLKPIQNIYNSIDAGSITENQLHGITSEVNKIRATIIQ